MEGYLQKVAEEEVRELREIGCGVDCPLLRRRGHYQGPEQPLGTESGLSPASSKKKGLSVLQLQRTEFCQQPE